MIVFLLFLSTVSPTPEFYTLSLHDALPICTAPTPPAARASMATRSPATASLAPVPARSEEHTSELQSHHDLVCRLLLEKKNNRTVLQQDQPSFSDLKTTQATRNQSTKVPTP